jgi:hypothetical protein
VAEDRYFTDFNASHSLKSFAKPIAHRVAAAQDENVFGVDAGIEC